MSNVQTKSGRQNTPVTLTNSLVEKLAPNPKGSYDIRDNNLKGFMVRVFPSGKKSYRCQYARGKHYTIGRTNTLTATYPMHTSS